MMLRKFTLLAAAAALTAAPVAAQAAPQRTAAPVSAQSEELRGGFILPAIIGVALLIVLWLAIDSDSKNDAPPKSP
jgi:hypothetical protein